jgi:signal transduction histidine kinase
MAGLAFAGSLALLRHGGLDALRTGSGADESQGLDLIGVVLTALATLPLFAWRHFPLGVFVATSATSVLMAGLGYPVGLLIGPTIALYLLAASRDQKAPWTGHTTATAIGLFVAYLGATGVAQGALPGVELLHTGLAWAGAWFAGERTRLRRVQMAELRVRTRRAERETERERLLAVAEERARIARDLHDSAGHAVSLIAVRAGAARLRHHQDPAGSLPALEAIEETARQTVEEIDQIVGTLREGGETNGAVEAPAGLASLDTLIATHAAAGLAVGIDTSGTPRSLGGAADQAAYRILQEALTNAARHGAGGVRIALAFGDEAVELTVTNPVATGGTKARDGHGAPRSGGGHGLIGMRERAVLLGGSLETGHANGAFRVRARIPYGGHRT